mmetsp:Transcript_11862/g.29038  ORF Transcript_11862/g.29038 Transcript_11862/m.29038 type:complete len:112 (+) Transcript_11862:67-402(+)
MADGVPPIEGAHMVMCAGTFPKSTKLQKGKEYFWCSCGRSKTQPFCDGSHNGTNFQPVKFTATSNGSKNMCMCKMTKNQPYCDGSHMKALCSCCTGVNVKKGRMYRCVERP